MVGTNRRIRMAAETQSRQEPLQRGVSAEFVEEQRRRRRRSYRREGLSNPGLLLVVRCERDLEAGRSAANKAEAAAR
jgi:hypothetical protein